MSRINFGVLGVSNHLIKRIVLPLKSTTNCKIIGIASRDNKKALDFANSFNIEKAYSSYQDLLDDPDIHAVYIPLPNHMHLEWVKKAANAGKHILCEKPIALNEKEALECIQAANTCRVNLMETFMYKFHPQWIHARNIIRTNQIGSIQSIQTSFAYHNPAPNNIRNIKEFGGGALMDIGCYAISISRFLLDKEPIRVCSLQDIHNDFQTDSLTSAMMDFNGCHSTFTVSTLSHPNQNVTIIGSAGSIKIDVPFNTYVDTPSSILISTAQGDRTITFDICDQYGLMFEAFADSIINKKQNPYSPIDAQKNMKVIDAIFKSSNTKDWVKI